MPAVAKTSPGRNAPFPGPFEERGQNLTLRPPVYGAASIEHTRSAVFRRNADSEPDWPTAVAFRRNTVTSPRKADACRTLATRRRSNDSGAKQHRHFAAVVKSAAEPNIRVRAVKAGLSRRRSRVRV